jgi:membrane-associated phospholipid phosphatase
VQRASGLRALLRDDYRQNRLTQVRGRNGIVIVAFLMGLFAIIFAIVRRNQSASTDAAITLRLQKQRHPMFNRLMHVVSWPGFPPQSRLIPPAMSAMLFTFGFRLEAAFQLLAWGSGGISFTFKRIMRRSRPNSDFPGIRVAVARIGGTSFPSGHVLNYLGVYGFLTFLAYVWIEPAVIRRVVVGLLAGLLALVGPSRVYLGHHWFTDVSASYLLGFSWLIGLTTLYRHVKSWQYARRQQFGLKRPPLW